MNDDDKEYQRAEHERDLARIAGFRLMDDDFMSVVFQDENDCTATLLRVIMNQPDLAVHHVVGQYELKNLQRRSIRLDIHAYVGAREYDIEVQRADKGASAKRARYHSSLMDANALRAGQDFDKLTDSCVIFITEHDPFGEGEPIYKVERCITPSNRPFNDGTTILYVNSTIQDDTPLGRLMHDFYCTNPDDMYYQNLATRARYFKQDDEGVKNMCKVIEDMRNETAKRVKTEDAMEMLKEKLPITQVARITKLSIDYIRQMAETRNIPIAEQ